MALLALLAAASSSCGGSDGAARDPGTQKPSTPMQASGGSPAKSGAGGTMIAQGGGAGGAGGAGGGGGAPMLPQPDTGGQPSVAPDAGHDAGSIAATGVAFRVSTLSLRDPHVYLTGTDLTDDPGVLGTSVNGSLINNGLTMDYDMDGFLDVSILPILSPLDPQAKSGELHLVDARCKSGTQCESSVMLGLDVRFTLENRTQGACLEPMPDTTSGFTPAVVVPMAPCFVTVESRDLTINLGGVSVALTAARIAASYDGDPPTRLNDGLLMGFVTDAHAMQALLPTYLPLLGGSPLSDYLRDQDRDAAHSPNSESGFWLYINFVATPVEYSAP